MIYLFDSQLKPRRVFSLHAVSVTYQLQRSGRPVRIDRAVVKQAQIQADSGLKMRKQAEPQIKLLFIRPFLKTAEHHGGRMILQHLHIPDHIPVLRFQKLRQADPAAFFSEKDLAGILSGFQHLCVFQHLRISQFSLCPVDLHFRFSSCSAASGRTFFYRILSRYSFDRIRLIFSANSSVAVAAEMMSETGSA